MNNIVNTIAFELRGLLNPIKEAVETSKGMVSFFGQMGWNLSKLYTTDLSEIILAINSIETLINEIGDEASTDSMEDVLEAIHAIGKISISLKKLFDAISKYYPSVFTEEVGEEFVKDLLEMLCFLNLIERNPVFFQILETLSIVDQQSVPVIAIDIQGNNFVLRYPMVRPTFKLENIAKLLRDPIQHLKSEYLLNGKLETEEEAIELTEKVLRRLGLITILLGGQASVGLVGASDKDLNDPSLTSLKRKASFGLTVLGVRIGLFIEVLPENVSGTVGTPGPGLEITPFGIVKFDKRSGNWRISLLINGSVSPIFFGSNKSNNSTSRESEFEIYLSLLKYSDDSTTFVFGSKTETRFEVGLFRIDSFFNSKGPDFGLGFYAGNCAFVLDAGNGDGFLSQLLPEEGIRVEFDFGLSWSRRDGIQLCGSLGLETELSMNYSILDIIELETVYLSLLGKSNTLSVAAGLTMNAKLGPITANIKQVGLKASYGFGEDENKGFHFGFKPPTGVGLSISAAGVIGGGFLEFDNDNERYSGVLALQFIEIGLTAIGLITTKMPDGSKGFALLINIGVTFDPPFQLAMGFTLNGVGGLIAVNRSMQVDVLQAGIKNHTLDSILFPDPKTLIANANKIISDLRAVFPPEEGQYVVGPMIKIGWGNGLLIADIGLFIQFPDPIRLVLLGQVSANIPNKEKAIVVINLDIIGVVDFAKEELTFQASLHDSRILKFEMSGDAAFLLGWGDNPQFAMAIGGFHPRFKPPPPAIVFADLKRLSISISSGKNFTLTCASYQAITSNSLQFGARADLAINLDPFSITGDFGFDALFIFSPFSFEVEISAGVNVAYDGYSLLEIDLWMLLSGPTPWHVKGKARIKILFVTIKIRFSHTWGRHGKATLPPVNPWDPYLEEAFENPDNWASVLPPRRGMVTMLRSLEKVPEANASNDAIVKTQRRIVVHPSGTLEVRQQVCPLGIQLQKFNQAPVVGYDRIDLKAITVAGEHLSGVPIYEFFARGRFQELTKDEQLSQPGFEIFQAGIKSKADLDIEILKNDFDVPDVATEELIYESILHQGDEIKSNERKDTTVAWNRTMRTRRRTTRERHVRRSEPLRRFSMYQESIAVDLPLKIQYPDDYNSAKPDTRTTKLFLKKRPFTRFREEHFSVVSTNNHNAILDVIFDENKPDEKIKAGQITRTKAGQLHDFVKYKNRKMREPGDYIIMQEFERIS